MTASAMTELKLKLESDDIKNLSNIARVAPGWTQAELITYAIDFVAAGTEGGDFDVVVRRRKYPFPSTADFNQRGLDAAIVAAMLRNRAAGGQKTDYAMALDPRVAGQLHHLKSQLGLETDDKAVQFCVQALASVCDMQTKAGPSSYVAASVSGANRHYVIHGVLFERGWVGDLKRDAMMLVRAVSQLTRKTDAKPAP